MLPSQSKVLQLEFLTYRYLCISTEEKWCQNHFGPPSSAKRKNVTELKRQNYAVKHIHVLTVFLQA